MPLLLLLIFVGVPILEIAVFIQAGGLIGLWPTLAAVVVTAVIGVALLRAQGLAALDRARRQLDRGQIPIAEVFTGVCLLIAGALLLTPGFITDAVGFLLLIPPVRETVGRWAMTKLVRSPNTRVWVDGEEVVRPHQDPTAPPSDAIDVEYTEITEPDDSPADSPADGRRPRE
ncbi:MAG: FxsA family protein [Alphaproteobacteria bacterium]|nr:FxsA family protein [Alphaproteobacteria bacterium]